MNVLIIGATGYVGTAIDESLSARGHRTYGIARSDAAKSLLEARGTIAVAGDATKPATLYEAARAADAVIYAVRLVEPDARSIELKALKMIGKALAGTEKTFVLVSDAWIYGPTGDSIASEDAPLRPPTLMSRPIELEEASLNLTRIGIRALNIRPGIVYGRAGGTPSMFRESARARGAATLVGEGENRWATIDIEDLGDFVALAVERGRPGRAYNAVNDDGFSMREIAEAASRGAGAGGATTSIPATMMGQWGACLSMDQRISSARAKADLGWAPRRPSIVHELEYGSYVEASLV
jgi:nucleoside-diphosphate-sugar epimerase